MYCDIESLGGELLAGVKNWIEWIGEQMERKSVGELAKIGEEEVSWARNTRVIFRPSFVEMSNKGWQRGKKRKWSNKGYRIDFIRGERKEVELRHMVESREIAKLMKDKGRIGVEEEEEQEKRGSFSSGVSIEAEYKFTKAVGTFSHKAIIEGT